MTEARTIAEHRSRIIAAHEHAWAAIRDQQTDVPDVVIVTRAGSNQKGTPEGYRLRGHRRVGSGGRPRRERFPTARPGTPRCTGPARGPVATGRRRRPVGGLRRAPPAPLVSFLRTEGLRSRAWAMSRSRVSAMSQARSKAWSGPPHAAKAAAVIHDPVHARGAHVASSCYGA